MLLKEILNKCLSKWKEILPCIRRFDVKMTGGFQTVDFYAVPSKSQWPFAEMVKSIQNLIMKPHKSE